MTTLIDSHCHPVSLQKEESTDPPGWLQRAQEAGVSHCIAIGTDPGDWETYRQLASRFPGSISWTAGLHPSYVGENYDSSLRLLDTYLASDQSPRPCALGEIGLDFTRLKKETREENIRWQSDAYSQQLQKAQAHDLPVVIHSRGTVTECLAILSETSFPPERAIFHCFAEGVESLQKIKAAGAHCSFTGIITFRSAENVREALAANGLENLILETDSPYLSPEPYRGKRNEPARIATIAEFCADFFKTDVETVARVSTENARRFFGL